MANAILLKPLVPAAVSAGGTAAGHSPDYALNDHAGVVWRSAALGSSLTLDFGADVTIDTVQLFGIGGAVAGWRVGITAASNAAFSAGVVAFAANTTPLLAGSAMPTSGRGNAYVTGPTTTRRYWRIEILDAGGSGVDVSVARVAMGVRVELERNFSFGAAFGAKDLGSLDFNRRGVLLRARGVKLRTVGLTFSHVRKDELEATLRPLLEYLGNTEMVALLTDPAADAQRQNRAYFGPIVGDLSAIWRNSAAFESKVNLVSRF